MSKITNIARNFDVFGSRISGTFINYVSKHEYDIVEQNIFMLRMGLMPDGTDIVPEYGYGVPYSRMQHYYYPDYKRHGAGSRFDMPERPIMTPNLGLTGAFYSSIHIKYEEDEFYLDSTDPKWNNGIGTHTSLHERYGDVLGVSNDYVWNVIVPGVKDELIKSLREQLSL